jgi:hypothetical protein
MMIIFPLAAALINTTSEVRKKKKKKKTLSLIASQNVEVTKISVHIKEKIKLRNEREKK